MLAALPFGAKEEAAEERPPVDPYKLAESWKHLFDGQADKAREKEEKLLAQLKTLPGGPSKFQLLSGPEWVEPPKKFTGFDMARITSTVTRVNSSNIPTITRRAYAPIPRPAPTVVVRVCQKLAQMPPRALAVLGLPKGVSGEQLQAVAQLVTQFGDKVDLDWIERLGPAGHIVLHQTEHIGNHHLDHDLGVWRSKMEQIEQRVQIETLGGEVAKVLAAQGILQKVQECRQEGTELRAHDHRSPRDVCAHAIAAALEPGAQLRLVAPPPEEDIDVHAQPIPRWTLGLAPQLELSKIELPADPGRRKVRRSTTAPVK